MKPHLIPAHQHGHLGTELREVAGFFTGRVSSAHDDHFLSAVEESVAHSTRADAATGIAQPNLGFEPQPLSRGTCRDDDRISVDFSAVAAFAHPDFVDRTGEVHLGHPTVAHIRVKALGLRLQVHHHLGPLMPSG